MTAKNETVGGLMVKLINTIGIIIIVFWGLEFTINVHRHPWWDFNVNHPIIMVLGLACAGLTLYKLFAKLVR